MPTYRTTSGGNLLRTPSGAPGEGPDGPGGMATLADDIESRFGWNGIEVAATTAVRDAIPAGRKYTGKRVRVTADGVTYSWAGSLWVPLSSAPQNFVPTFAGLTLGNGSAGGSYWWSEGTLKGRLTVTWGSTSAGPGGLLFNLPDNRYTADQAYPHCGAGYVQKGGSGALTPLTARLDTGYRFALWAAAATAPMSATNVVTLASGDVITAAFDAKMS